MSTKTEIRKYLAAGHDTFTTNQIAAITGLPIKTISTAANQMCKSGELVVESRTWRKTVYRSSRSVEQKNTICDECRQNWQGYQIHKIFGSARV